MMLLTLVLAIVGAVLYLVSQHGIFAMLAYTGNNATPSNNFDMGALNDADFTGRNSPLHYVFTEDYNILYLTAQCAHITDARLVTPTFNAINSDGQRIYSYQKKAGLGGVPTLFDKYTGSPLPMPKYEELQFQTSSGTIEQTWGLLHIAPPNWSNAIPPGPITVMEGTTSSFTPAANVWSGPQTLNLTANPRGQVYAVIRATCQQAADSLAFRLVFPRHPFYKGRKLRPGWTVQNAVADFDDVITQINPFHLGVWGWFHTLELPQVEVLASTSAAMTPIFRLWCVPLGGDTNLLDAIIRQNSVS